MGRSRRRQQRDRDKERAYKNGMKGFEKSLNDCETKKAYFVAREAKAVAKMQRMRAYNCPFCKLWHLTSQ